MARARLTTLTKGTLSTAPEAALQRALVMAGALRSWMTTAADPNAAAVALYELARRRP